MNTLLENPPAVERHQRRAASGKTRYATWLLITILLFAGAAITMAMRNTSTTFDEIVLIAGGARGYETGDWSIAPEHPPLMQYVYGLPVYLDGASYPEETDVPEFVRKAQVYRYEYARAFFWKYGNDPERLAFLGRIPAVLCALGLIVLVFCYTRRIAGDVPALVAAALTAALPDVLAHGGVAYNDIPVALAMLGGVWAIDSGVRAPTVWRGLIAGVVIAIALAVKNTAVALAPIAAVLFVIEAIQRRSDRQWWRGVVKMSATVLASAWLTLVLVYRGDPLLSEYRYSIGFAFGHVTAQPVPSFLLGERIIGGSWQFFPIAFLFKTSAGLHALIAVAVIFTITRLCVTRQLPIHSRLRGPIVALCVLSVLLLSSSLNIGFRHALPAVPPIVMLTAIAVVRLWPIAGKQLRVAVVAAGIWSVVSVASYYPFFLSYISEYGPGKEANHTVLADSNVDWGQGLLALREFMREHDISSVYLSYFGSALPAGYGISYMPLASYFQIPSGPPLPQEPEWIAVSTTNLNGVYVDSDILARLRDVRPDYVIANTMYLYRVRR